ncbi:alpha/beta hydrolase [Aestuariibius sp. 2305UL40-4]|uniref:alpha/beta hydrolase n=1 Tax=Aestuariibius violaceus TaxID=3234132 RepID=UPI00345EE044
MELDDAYANAAHIPGAEAYPEKWRTAAEGFRAQARCELDLPYGEHPREVFDLFHPERSSLGLIVFVHGGYWMRFSKDDFSHLAAGPVAQGWSVALPSYPLAPERRLREIGFSVRKAVDQIARRMVGPVVLTGHSAGGQAVLRLGCRNTRVEVRNRIARIVAISPVADLRPLMRTSMNETLKIDDEEAKRESPMLRRKKQGIDVTVWVGAKERPAFLDQAEDMAKAWDVEHVVDPGRHHFDVIEGLEDPESAVVRALVGERIAVG